MTLKEDDFTLINIRIFEDDKLLYTSYEKDKNETKYNVSEKTIYEKGPHFYIVGDESRSFEKYLPLNITPNKIEIVEVNNFEGGKNKKKVKMFKPSSFKESRNFHKGGYFYFQDENAVGLIKSYSPNNDRMIVDFNHPFAGKNLKLHFELIKKLEDLAEKIKYYVTMYLELPTEKANITLNSENKTIIFEFKDLNIDPEKVKPLLKIFLKEKFPELEKYDFQIKLTQTKKEENSSKSQTNNS